MVNADGKPEARGGDELLAQEEDDIRCGFRCARCRKAPAVPVEALYCEDCRFALWQHYAATDLVVPRACLVWAVISGAVTLGVIFLAVWR
jgi:hypothetical protein